MTNEENEKHNLAILNAKIEAYDDVREWIEKHQGIGPSTHDYCYRRALALRTATGGVKAPAEPKEGGKP